MAAHQAPQFLGFSRREYWSVLPFPSQMHESEKWKWSRSVVSDSLRPHGLQPSRLLHPWYFPGKSTGVGCHAFSAFTPSVLLFDTVILGPCSLVIIHHSVCLLIWSIFTFCSLTSSLVWVWFLFHNIYPKQIFVEMTPTNQWPSDNLWQLKVCFI